MKAFGAALRRLEPDDPLADGEGDAAADGTGDASPMAPESALAAARAARLRAMLAEHQLLLGRTPAVPDPQAAWVLLVSCAAARANYDLRAIRHELAEGYAEERDKGIL